MVLMSKATLENKIADQKEETTQNSSHEWLGRVMRVFQSMSSRGIWMGV